MLRQGIRRCASQASSLAFSASRVTASRAALQITRQTAPALRHSIAPVNRAAYASRFYSYDAAAAEEGIKVNSDEPIDQFADLAQLGVHENLIKAITRDMGYQTMTPVQSKTINPALKGTDIVAQAKTGTGKTLAFLLPLLQRMIEEDPTLAQRGASRRARSDDIRGIVMSPTRELAEQIAEEARRLTRGTGLVVQAAVGGTNKPSMLRQMQRQGCHLLVATPGRLNDLLSDPSSGVDAPNLAALVLDEADRMLDVGFEQELNDIIEMLPSKEEKTRQTMLVSATIPDNVIRLARNMVRPENFEFVQTIPEHESLTHDKVPQHVVPVSSWGNMIPALFELIDTESAKLAQDPDSKPFKAIVYFNTTAMVELVSEIFYQRRRSGHQTVSSFSIHSRLTQAQRTKSADYFRRAKSAILCSSDVTARGMDFPDVTHVIQVDMPRDRESYIHRLGRTGRQNKEGQGWLLLTPTSVGPARKMLGGLPIQPNKSIESAEADLEAETLPELHEQFKTLVQRVSSQSLMHAYTSLFGGSQGKNDLAEDLYLWTTKGCGMDDAPVVSHSWARNMGLDTRFLNIGQTTRRSGEDRFGSHSRNGPRTRGPSEDAFSEMGQRIRRDDGSTGRSNGHQRWGNRGNQGQGWGRNSRSKSESTW